MRVYLEPDEPRVLPIPYRTPGEPDRRYFDLKRRPALIARIREIDDCADLRDLVVALNRPEGGFATLGCAHWEKPLSGQPTRLREAGAYVDVVFDDLRVAKRRARYLDLYEHLRAAAPPDARRSALPTAVIRVQPQRVAYTARGTSAWLLSIWMFGAGRTLATARARRRACMSLVASVLPQPIG